MHIHLIFCFCCFAQIISAAFGLFGFVILAFWLQWIKNTTPRLQHVYHHAPACVAGVVGFSQCTRSRHLLSCFRNMLPSPPATRSGTVTHSIKIRPLIDIWYYMINITHMKACNDVNVLCKKHDVVLWFQPAGVPCGKCLDQTAHCASFREMLSVSQVRYIVLLCYVSVYVEVFCARASLLMSRSLTLIAPACSLAYCIFATETSLIRRVIGTRPKVVWIFNRLHWNSSK